MNLQFQELPVAHDVGSHGPSCHHSSRGRVEHHHAGRAKEVVWLQGASVGATDEDGCSY